MDNLRAWMQQPSSVAGIATILGSLSALVSRQLSWAQAGPLIVAAVVSFILPDNSKANNRTDQVSAVNSRN